MGLRLIFRSWQSSDFVLMIPIKSQTEHFGILFIFSKESVIRGCAHLMLVTLSGSGKKSHLLDFLGDFRSCPLPEIDEDAVLQT